MRKEIQIILFILSLTHCVNSQSLKIRDYNTLKDITGDTILKQSKYNGGWVGYESLDLLLIVENTSNKTIETGAKKMEPEKFQKDVLHTFCFAGACFDTGTYVSPNHVSLGSGLADSNFIAHYLFDNTVHVRGINHVAYVFYDVMNPNDSSVVFVTYNTNISNTGIKQEDINNFISSPFPNPVVDFVSFMLNSGNTYKPHKVTVNNILGEVMETIQFPPEMKTISFSMRSLPSGVYYCSFFEDNALMAMKKIMVRR